MLDTWRIAKSRRACSRCGAEFEQNRAFFSSLIEQDGELVREDFCTGCWEGHSTERFFCFWRSRRAPAHGRQPVDTGLMIEFFDRLSQPDSEKKKVFRFVVALYLMRRKELKLTGVRRSDRGEIMTFSRKGSDATVEVENPNLTEDQVQEASEQLARLLNATL